MQEQRPAGTMGNDSESEDETGLLEQSPLQAPSHQTNAKATTEVVALQRSITKLDHKVKGLRQTVSWLVTERQQTGRKLRESKSSRRRRYVRRKMLLRRVKGLKFDKHSLSLSLEKYRSLLRVKETQRARKRQMLKRQQQHTLYRDRGPRVLVSEKPDTATSERISFNKDEVDELGQFWRSVWQVKGKYHKDHPAIQQWVRDTQTRLAECQEDLTPVETPTAWAVARKKMASWKAPGPDSIHAYWYKALVGLAECLRELLSEMLESPTTQIPQWFVRRRTVLIPKEPGSTKPDQQRPITCLNTAYKLLTGTLTVILQSHVARVGLLPLEQKALRKGARGCMDALAIDTTVATEVKRGKKNLLD